jgi:hypothetical protein
METLLEGKGRVDEFGVCWRVLDTILCLVKPDNFLQALFDLLVLLYFTLDPIDLGGLTILLSIFQCDSFVFDNFLDILQGEIFIELKLELKYELLCRKLQNLNLGGQNFLVLCYAFPSFIFIRGVFLSFISCKDQLNDVINILNSLFLKLIS